MTAKAMSYYNVIKYTYISTSYLLVNIHSEIPTETYVPLSAERTVGDIVNKSSCVIQLRSKTDSQQYNQP